MSTGKNRVRVRVRCLGIMFTFSKQRKCLDGELSCNQGIWMNKPAGDYKPRRKRARGRYPPPLHILPSFTRPLPPSSFRRRQARPLSGAVMMETEVLSRFSVIHRRTQPTNGIPRLAGGGECWPCMLSILDGQGEDCARCLPSRSRGRRHVGESCNKNLTWLFPYPSSSEPGRRGFWDWRGGPDPFDEVMLPQRASMSLGRDSYGRVSFLVWG
ncbi:hypothetical protein B0T24DRAFT_25131 [Lasiosphaeria ovina]|uniref:Uncharacterized protein n=1 Tax=Lasiosphaeria ovina TaxID=92902 RepID=A0AAE0NJS1_9PEZI|nr:hypothetical protein B0T24DRAFT_25131 [Lasiosphaeria ovina]